MPVSSSGSRMRCWRFSASARARAASGVLSVARRDEVEVEGRRLRPPGAQAVHRDAVARGGCRELAGEAHEPVLGGGVRDRCRGALRRARSDVDDAAGAALTHQRQRHGRRPPRRREVQREVAEERVVVGRERVEVATALPPTLFTSTSTRPNRSMRGVHRTAGAVGVEPRRRRPPGPGRRRRPRRGARLRARTRCATRPRHRALGGVAQRDGAPDAASRPGDDRDPVVELPPSSGGAGDGAGGPALVGAARRRAVGRAGCAGGGGAA